MRASTFLRAGPATCVAAALSAAFLLALLFDVPGGRGTVAVDDLANVAAPLVAAAAAWWASGGAKGATRLAWRLIAASAGAWAAGQMVWSVYELALGRDVPFPSLADVGYLLAVPLGVAGMLLLAAPARDAALRLRAFLDGVIIAIATLIVSWILVLGPVVRASSGSSLEQAIGLAYPLADVLTGSIAVYAVSRAPVGRRRPVVLASLAFLALAVADSGFAYLTTLDGYATGNLIDVGWFAGFLLLAIAALDARARPEDRTADALRTEAGTTMTALVPYAPFGAVLVVGVLAIPRGEIDPFVLYAGFFMVLFVVSRQLFHIIDHVELAGKLREANAELVRVQGFRAQLLNNVSHDLATPLTPIVLQVKLLETTQPTEPQRRSLAVLRRNVEQLQRLVRDVKDVARLQAGGLQLEPRATELAGLVRSAVESFQGAADERGIHLEARLPDGPLPVHADAQRLTQITFNLLTNALKFTEPGGHVTVLAAIEGDHARVSVRDDGRGLDRAQMARLFHPFSQVHDDLKQKGSGLGLYISRGIVEQHGGRMAVESEGPGKGATFWWTIPLTREPAPTPTAGRASAVPA